MSLKHDCIENEKKIFKKIFRVGPLFVGSVCHSLAIPSQTYGNARKFCKHDTDEPIPMNLVAEPDVHI